MIKCNLKNKIIIKTIKILCKHKKINNLCKIKMNSNNNKSKIPPNILLRISEIKLYIHNLFLSLHLWFKL